MMRGMGMGMRGMVGGMHNPMDRVDAGLKDEDVRARRE
jgi:hypothetical protein